MKEIHIMTTGADPEGFFVKKGTDTIIPAIGLLGGTKEAPRDLGDGVAIQEDNVLVEFNVKPAGNGKEFAENIQDALKKVEAACDAAGGVPTFQTSAVEFPEDVLAAAGEKAFQNGCDPDYDAWAFCAREPVPYHASKYPLLRAAGGHFHFGFDRTGVTAEDDAHLIRSLDYLVGVPLMLMEPYTRRRETFGTSGYYRPKSYGIEWRAPTNYWVTLKPEHLTRLVKATTYVGIARCLVVEHYPELQGPIGQPIWDVITSDASRKMRLEALTMWAERAHYEVNAYGREAIAIMRKIGQEVLSDG